VCNAFRSKPANLDEELSRHIVQCDPNQEKATVWGEESGSEGAERKPVERHTTMLPRSEKLCGCLDVGELRECCVNQGRMLNLWGE